MLLEDAAGDGLNVVSVDALVSRAVELNAGTLEALLDVGVEYAESTGLEWLARTELKYCDEDTGTTTVVEDVAVKLDPLLPAEVEGVTVGYTAELGTTGAERL